MEVRNIIVYPRKAGWLECYRMKCCLHLLRDVNCPVRYSAWVKDLVAVLVPGQPEIISQVETPTKDGIMKEFQPVRIALATPQLDPIVEC